MSEYVPRDGSTAQRAIWHCQSNGAASTTELCDELDVPRGGLMAGLTTAVRFGALHTAMRKGERWYDVQAFDPATVDAEPSAPVAPPEPPPAPAPAQRQAQAASPLTDALLDKPWRKGKRAKAAHARTAAAPPAPRRKPGPKPGSKRKPKVEVPSRPAPPASVAEIPVQQLQPVPFACGVFSDGRIVVEKGGQQITLGYTETKTLLRFLERMASEPA